MEKIVTYLQATLGENLIVLRAKKELLDKLPLYINSTYEIWEVVIFDREVLLLGMGTKEHLTPLQYQKHKEQVEKKTGAVVVFVLSDIKAYNRNRLVQKKINFVIENKQLFIPQLLIDLKEYMPKTQIKTVVLQPAAQVLLLYHIHYKNLAGSTYKELSKLLEYSYLTISRAVDNLVKLELCKTEGKKVKSLVFISNKRELWRKALPFLTSPIKKTVFINDILPENLTRITNINALAFYSDLNGDRKRHFAIQQSKFIKLKKKGFIKQTSQYDGDYHIELWRYDPCLLAETKVVDPLSLYLTYMHSKDERIEMALEQITEQFEW